MARFFLLACALAVAEAALLTKLVVKRKMYTYAVTYKTPNPVVCGNLVSSMETDLGQITASQELTSAEVQERVEDYELKNCKVSAVDVSSCSEPPPCSATAEVTLIKNFA